MLKTLRKFFEEKLQVITEKCVILPLILKCMWNKGKNGLQSMEQDCVQREYHIPVMLEQSIDGLNINPSGTYVDVTFGGGGHSRAILSHLGAHGRLLGFDQDLDTINRAPHDSRFTFVRSNFRYLNNFLRYYDVLPVDGILADLGVSSHHLDDASRGFSFRFEAPLDMRMNQRATLTAANVVNDYPEERLQTIFALYGELPNSRRLASALVKARAAEPLLTMQQLLAVASPLMPRQREKKELAKLMQALRMEVNHETDALSEMLQAAVKSLRPGGRLVVITYHSIEDRMVKNFMKSGNIEGHMETDFYGRTRTPLRMTPTKPITPTNEEVERNPRSRSAKLRIAERLPIENDTQD